MLLKLLGAAIIMSGASFGGFAAANRLKKRCLILRGIENGFIALEREIGFSAAFLSTAMAEASYAAGVGGELFVAAAKSLAEKNGLSATEIWRQAVKGSRLDLKDSEKEILFALGDGLGISDIKEQLKRLQLCRLRIDDAAKEAEAEYRQMGRLYRNLGWALGLMMVLMLF